MNLQTSTFRPVHVNPRVLVTVLLAALVIVAGLLAGPASADAAPARPALGVWKVTPDGSKNVKRGSMRVVNKRKKVAKLKFKPRGKDKIDRCGSKAAITLRGKAKIKKFSGLWRVARKTGPGTHYGQHVKLKQGKRKFKGQLLISFADAKTGNGLLVGDKPGCYMYFNVKKK